MNEDVKAAYAEASKDDATRVEAIGLLKAVLDAYEKCVVNVVVSQDSDRMFDFYRAVNAASVYLAGVEAMCQTEFKYRSFADIMNSPTRGPKQGLWINTIGGSCPCQADGTMDGNPFYFRARHGEWSLRVVKPGFDPVSDNDDGIIEEFDGPDPENGYMSCEEAAKIITDCWGTMKLKSLERRNAK